MFPVMLLAAQKSKPNIIFILADDMGYGDVSAFDSNSKFKTTNLDDMASCGMRFTDAHTTSSVSTPTRYGVVTGRYNWRSPLQEGVLVGDSAPLIEKDRMTVATMLGEQGYSTAAIGKWHLGMDWYRNSEKRGDVDLTAKGVITSPNDNGFEYSYVIPASLDFSPYVYIENHNFATPINGYIEKQTGLGFYRNGPIAEDFDIGGTLEHLTDKSVEYIKEKSKEDKPFFLYFPMTAPHTPILPPAEFQGKSGATPYGDFVLYVDSMVGRVREAVKEAGIEENTIIIFTTDNGCSPEANIVDIEATGHYPNSIYRGRKRDIFEGGHRVPYIVEWKGEVEAGSTAEAPITLATLMATCADITDYNLPSNAAEDSFSILPMLQGKKGDMDRPIIHHSCDGYFALRVGDWKLCACPHSGSKSGKPTIQVAQKENYLDMQLYNLKDDPSEKINLYEKYPKRVAKMYKQLEEMVFSGATRSGAVGENDVEVVIRKDLSQK